METLGFTRFVNAKHFRWLISSTGDRNSTNASFLCDTGYKEAKQIGVLLRIPYILLVGSLSIAELGHIALGYIARESDTIDNTGSDDPFRRRHKGNGGGALLRLALAPSPGLRRRKW